MRLFKSEKEDLVQAGNMDIIAKCVQLPTFLKLLEQIITDLRSYDSYKNNIKKKIDDKSVSFIK